MPISSYFKRDGVARGSVTLKLIAIAVLVLIFLIPVSMVRGLINERQFRQQDVAREVGNTWGAPQTLAGPILVVPYHTLTTEGKRKEDETKYAYFLPDKLGVSGTVAVEIRSRGIYDVPVYSAALGATGFFRAPDIKLLSLKPEQMRWDKAQLVVGLPDLRGVREEISLDWAGAKTTFAPGVVAPVVPTGVSAAVALQLSEGAEARQGVTYPFTINLNTRGSEQLFFVPVGKETSVALNGNWPSPSFTGAFLPESRALRADGFTANWRVLDLNRDLSQQWVDGDGRQLGFAGMSEGARFEPEGFMPFPGDPPTKAGFSSDHGVFGVRLFTPVDIYQKSLRSVKYGISVIALVFVVIFFVEFSARKRVHPVQYVLIGLALVIYYTLLLAFAEHLRFGWAYLIASVAVIGLNTLFVRSAMESGVRALLTGGILTMFYGFVYILLQLEDYALLLGSVALFITLAIIMYLSRKIDWYGTERIT